MKRYVLLLLLVVPALASKIQVVDQQNGQALVGVNITIVGTNEGLNTDAEGYFTLETIDPDQFFRFTYMGYQDTTLSYAVLKDLKFVQLMPQVLDLNAVVVVSSKLEWEQTDLPSIVTVLRTRDLIDQGSVEIKEVLQRDPSVVVDESTTGEHEISIRGSNANEVMIIYDGIPLNSSYAGGFDLSWLDLNDIETISIIKGGGTLRYGAGAFGGVVVIESLRSGGSGLSLSGQRNDRGLQSMSISDILQTRHVRSRLTYSTRELLPFGYYNDSIVSQRDFLNYSASYALRDTANTFSLSYVDIGEEVVPNQYYLDNSNDRYAQLAYRGRIVIPNLLFQVLTREKSRTQMDHSDPLFLYDDKADETTELAVIEQKWVTPSIVNFIRTEYKRDRYKSLSQSENVYWSHLDEHTIELDQQWLAFTDIFKYRTKIEIPYVDFMELNASYRYDMVSLDKLHQAVLDGDMYREETSTRETRQISRRNGFTLNKSHQDLKYQFFYSAGTSLRYPTMRDLYQREITTIVAYMDTSLNPELNSSSEVGTQISFTPRDHRAFLDRVDIQASLFRNRYIDKIYYRSIPRALPTPINFAGTTELNGFEASVLASLFGDRVHLLAGTSRLDISSFTIFPNKPKFKDVLEAEVSGRLGNLRLQYFHEGQQYYAGTLDNINVYTAELPGRENVNLYTSLKLHLSGKTYVVGLSALNLLSDKDDENYLTERKGVINLGIRL